MLIYNPQLVFVYGTLKNGFGNHARYLSGDNAKFIGKTSIPGVLLHLGGLPGLKEDDVCRVHGEVYEITWDKLTELDGLEGVPHLYFRKQIKTSLGTCWTYYWTRHKDVALTDDTLVVNYGVWRGGKNDKEHYSKLRAMFQSRHTATVAEENQPPAHIARPAHNLSVVGIPVTVAPQDNKGPIVGPGLEEM